MKKVRSLVLLLLAACSAPGAQHDSFPEAQRIVEQVAARHTDVVRLTIHAVPSRSARNVIVATNVAAKLGAASDPEDIEAMTSKQAVVLKEGDHLDYTAPVIDAAGRAIAAVGVTVRGASETAMRTSAESIARELSAAILAAGDPLW